MATHLILIISSMVIVGLVSIMSPNISMDAVSLSTWILVIYGLMRIEELLKVPVVPKSVYKRD